MNNTNRAAKMMNEALRQAAAAGARSAMNAPTVKSAYPALRMAKKSAALRNRICDDLRNAV